MNEKGLATISEVLLALGAILAASVFFLVGSEMIGFQVGEFYDFSETRALEDISNKVDRASGGKGITRFEYTFPVETYTLKSNGEVLMLKTPGEKMSETRMYGMEIEEFTIRDKSTICVTVSNESIRFIGDSCKDLEPGSDFCEGLMCVNGVCQTQYGEDCKNPDCSCNTTCCPDSPLSDVDEKGCLKEDSVESQLRGEQCGCIEICSQNLNCTPTAEEFKRYPRACCDNKTLWNGTTCRKLRKGEECFGKGWCKKDNTCNPTTSKFEEFEKACCPPGKGWNGTDCERVKKLVFLIVQVNGQVSGIKSIGKQIEEDWTSMTAMKKCPNSVEAEVVDDKVCNVGKMGPRTLSSAYQKVKQCARDWGYANKYTKIGGFVPSPVVFRIGAGGAKGVTQRYGDVAFSGMMSPVDTMVHEFGHTFGLCDIGYGGGSCPKSQCESGYCGSGGLSCSGNGPCCPNHPMQGSFGDIYCSVDKCNVGCHDAYRFTDPSKEHLKKELKEYCPGVS